MEAEWNNLIIVANRNSFFTIVLGNGSLQGWTKAI